MKILGIFIVIAQIITLIKTEFISLNKTTVFNLRENSNYKYSAKFITP
jgi:hypothetical protein